MNRFRRRKAPRHTPERLRKWQRIKMKPTRYPYPALARNWQANPPQLNRKAPQ